MRRASERPARIAAKELQALNAWRTSTLVFFTAGVLLVTIVVAVAVGSRRMTTDTTPDLAQAVITPQSLPTVPADARATPDATVTPTPRLIVVAEPTPTSRSAATPSARSTATAPAGIAFASETPSPRASPTGTPPPPAVSTSTDTATQAPSAAGSAGVIPAASWEGAFSPRDALHFGRPWVAIYGNLSVYSRATAVVRLDAAPTAPATLTLTGIDDEWLDLNPIAVEVNGQQVFTGAIPLVNWDGTSTGAATAWTPVTITIAPELLRAGRNRITIVNQSPSGNIGSPPYVLLGDASLQAPGATVTVLEPEPEAQPEASGPEGGQDDDDGDDG